MVKNLKSLRNQKGISQQQLASVLGISQQSVNKYENHNVEPDIETLIAMAEYFDTTIDFLVGRVEARSDSEDFTASEQALIADYRTLGKTEQICVNTLISTYKAMKK